MSMQARLFGKKCVSAVWIIIVLAFTMTFTGRAYPQVAGATLTGTVSDASGAVIPNAQVIISDVATGATRTASANSAGLYNAPNLLPGNYEVKVAAPGFRTQLEKGITLTVGAEQLL